MPQIVYVSKTPYIECVHALMKKACGLVYSGQKHLLAAILKDFTSTQKCYNFGLQETISDVIVDLSPFADTIFIPFNDKNCLFLAVKVDDLNSNNTIIEDS